MKLDRRYSYYSKTGNNTEVFYVVDNCSRVVIAESPTLYHASKIVSALNLAEEMYGEKDEG